MADTVVITGASSGIGLAVAERFVRDGARVIALSRRPCPLPEVESLQVDLRDASAVAGALATIQWSAVEDHLHVIHAAAAMPADTAESVDPEALAATLQLNVVAPAQINAGLLSAMSPGSAIVFVGSTLGDKGVPNKLSYVTSKHALVGLMRATVQDLFGRGIHTVCVAPGFVDTPMLRPALDADPAFAEAVRSMVSFGRLLAPDEVADIVAFAVRTPALNGAVVHANLGQREA